VAALLLVFIITTPLLINTEIKESNPEEYLAMIDTVYIDKVIHDTIEIIAPADTVIKTVYTTQKSRTTGRKEIKAPEFSAKMNSMTQLEEEFIKEYEEIHSPINFGNHTAGKSLSDDPVGRVILNIPQ
jgi:hypothetical protein